MKKYIYYKADLSLLTQEEGKTMFQDHGIIQTFTAKNRVDLLAKIEHTYELKEWDVVDHNHLSCSTYSIEEEGVVEDYSIYFYKVEEEGANITHSLKKWLKEAENE